MPIVDRLKNAWNAFLGRDPTQNFASVGPGFSIRPDRARISSYRKDTIITPIYNRIAIDVAAVRVMHARIDENGSYTETIDSKLNNCLTLEANKDQTGRAFIQDAAMSLLDEGSIAIVPIDVTVNPYTHDSFEIETMRIGKIIEWYPDYIRVRVYNDRTGQKEEITVPKRSCAIVENPLYAVMNEKNSIAQRLMQKLSLVDVVDEQNSSAKLDLIIQLPYVIKSQARKEQAEARRKDIESQLAESKYGVAYTDGTEKIVQLNRSLESNLMVQVQYLTSMLYGQLGITEEVLNGTADEKTMLNYYNRTIEPILAAICDEMKRKFLTKTARTQGQSIVFIRDPFKLVPVNDLAEIADKFTRNAILSSNELRSLIGFKPVDDQRANELRNKNLNPSDAELENPIMTDDEGGESIGQMKVSEIGNN